MGLPHLAFLRAPALGLALNGCRLSVLLRLAFSKLASPLGKFASGVLPGRTLVRAWVRDSRQSISACGTPLHGIIRNGVVASASRLRVRPCRLVRKSPKQDTPAGKGTGPNTELDAQRGRQRRGSKNSV